MTPSRGHSFDPRRTVHLSVASFERGVMIQFCGVVRLWHHFRFGFLRTGNRWRNAVINYVYTYEIFVFSTVTPSRGHSFDPRQAVHLSVALFERGESRETIQFCGVVRLWYHFRFGFSRDRKQVTECSYKLRIYIRNLRFFYRDPKSWSQFRP